MNLINLNVVSTELWRIPQFNFPTTCSVCPKTERTLHSLLLGHPLFFLHLASSDRPKFLEISNKKKCNYVVEPFFTWNNSFNLKNEHSNSIEKNRNKDMNIFYSILCILLIQICECLTFNVVLGYRGLLFRDFLWLFFSIFLIRPSNKSNNNLLSFPFELEIIFGRDKLREGSKRSIWRSTSSKIRLEIKYALLSFERLISYQFLSMNWIW